MHLTSLPDKLGPVAVPRTPLAREAEAFIRAEMEPWLFNHSVRAYAFGALESARHGRACDEEIAFVGALFHDLGLCPAHMSANDRFELDGADAAREFMTARGIDAERVQTAWLAIAVHACGAIPLRLGPEIAALAFGTSTDVAGLGLDRFDPSDVRAILEAAPRDTFKSSMPEALIAYGRRKPRAQLFTFTDSLVRAHAPELNLPMLDAIIAAAPFAS